MLRINWFSRTLDVHDNAREPKPNTQISIGATVRKTVFEESRAGPFSIDALEPQADQFQDQSGS
jgi:hypothetical protein